MTTNTRPTRDQIFWAMGRTLADEYGAERLPSELTDNTRIYRDLHADEPHGRIGALAWLQTTIVELGLAERRVIQHLAYRTQGNPPKPSQEHDYTLGEIADAIESAFETSA